jgi:hypothetical protein
MPLNGKPRVISVGRLPWERTARVSCICDRVDVAAGPRMSYCANLK